MKAANFLEKSAGRQDYKLIAFYEESAGEISRAINTCLSNNDNFKAADIAEKYNMKETAETAYKKIIDEFVFGKNYYVAISFAAKKGLLDKAMGVYEILAEKGVEERMKDGISYETGALKELAKISQKKDVYEDAIKFAKEHGLNEKVKELSLKASTLYQRLGRTREGYWAYHNGFCNAINLAEEAGDKEKVRVILEETLERLWVEDDWNITSSNLKDEMETKAKKYGLTDKIKAHYLGVVEECEKVGTFDYALELSRKVGLEEKIKSLSAVCRLLA